MALTLSVPCADWLTPCDVAADHARRARPPAIEASRCRSRSRPRAARNGVERRGQLRARRSAAGEALRVLADEGRVDRPRSASQHQQPVPEHAVGAGPDGEMQVGAFAGGGAARIDVDDAHAALGPRRLDALVQHRVAPGRVGADQHHEVGELQVVVALRHDVGAEGAAMPGHRRGHAQPRVGVDVRRADEAFRQLVGDVVVLGQQLPREVEGDRARARALLAPLAGAWRPGRARASQSACAPSTDAGCSSRVSSPSVSPSAEPLEHSRPKLAGCSGSPAMAAPPLPSGVASTPQPTPQ